MALDNPYAGDRNRAKCYQNGYEAGKNGWRYCSPNFRTDAVANEAYNKGWKKGCAEREAWDKELGVNNYD